jgi:hypothetical protein
MSEDGKGETAMIRNSKGEPEMIGNEKAESEMMSAYRTVIHTRSMFASRARVLAAGLALVYMVHLPGRLWGQNTWANCPGGLCYNGGNVGIGTASPGSFLNASGIQVPALLLDISPGATQAGGIIVGSPRTETGPSVRQGYFLRRSDNWVSAFSGMWKGSNSTGSEEWEHLVINNDGGGPDIVFMQNESETMRIDGHGTVGIGTANPRCPNATKTCLLSVNGAIATQEVVVTNAPMSDYVFKPEYRLRQLSEVGAYVQEHHHLPGIPSESEVAEKGVNVGDMQAKLLEKVEELTLYMIHEDQTNKELTQRVSQADERNSRLEQQNQELQQRVARLEARRVPPTTPTP